VQKFTKKLEVRSQKLEVEVWKFQFHFHFSLLTSHF
jgi:hypothetical protein